MTEHLPYLALVSSVLDTIELWLDEADAPLTLEQQVAFKDARAFIDRQQVLVGSSA